MKHVRHKRLLTVILTLALCVTVTAGALYYPEYKKRQGIIIGDNPNHLKKSELPYCNFTGAEFVEKPCYSPYGAQYE